MRVLFCFLFILCCAAAAAQGERLHHRSVVADTHNDVLSSVVLEGLDISRRHNAGHSDLERWREGGVDLQFFSVWTDRFPRNRPDSAAGTLGFFRDALEEIDSLAAIISRNPGRIALVRSYREAKKTMRRGKLAALIGVEGGHMIEDDPAKLDSLFRRGMRYLTLTWNNSTSWASSALDETRGNMPEDRKGLNEFGKEIVRQMNRLGVIVDLSHVGERTFYDALAVTTRPVLLSHSSVWAICPVFRNVNDEQIRAVARNGGVICINFYSGFIDSNYAKREESLRDSIRMIVDSLGKNMDAARLNQLRRKYFSEKLEPFRPGVKEVVDHIDHIVRLVGDEHVGLGSDFDGVSSLPRGLDDVSTYPLITRELLSRGYSKRSIRKILGRNVLRVMKANFVDE
ncbi:MAG TPA: dipeptidase [Chitinophagaceae bacterium]|nr:dipeptidase [Chitinophagaceae bacterium]